ncbi:MFS transporter [Leuconostoc gelidum]|uniref:MFS transporter n=1 Tax=Leuconostoc gelidum TaxID=1244 RepID=UPI0002191ED7|nr:MFS transporter [Leuconostoc gelidum]AFS39467.1 transport protein [Leuconostoc gelidum JB7]MBZ5992173.1 MFS transporter [Leuconostoc gelidum subsp. gelidum]USP17359.1 MFS transporter [Leuconostoc gelidum subsp. aenigmaticum]
MLLLRTNKLLRNLTLSQFIELLGAAFFNIALLVYASQTSNAKLATTVVVIANTLPTILQIGLGYIADKSHDKLRLMILTRLVQTILYGTLTILFELTMNDWLLFSFIIFINVSSDLLSGMTSLAALPIIKHIVPSQDLLAARSVQVSVMSLVNVIGQVIGVTFLTFLNNNFFYFSLFNAVLFLMSGLVLIISKRQFNQKLQATSHINRSSQVPEVRFWASMQINRRIIQANKKLLHILFLFTLLNLLVGSIDGLISLTLLQYPGIYIKNYGFSLSIVNTVLALGLVSGSFFTNDFLKKIHLNMLTIILLLFLTALGLNIVVSPNIYAIIISFFGIGYTLGKISPRVSTYVMTSVAEKQLGQIAGFMNTLVTLSVPIGQLIFLSIATSMSLSNAWISMIVLEVLLILYTLSYKVG